MSKYVTHAHMEDIAPGVYETLLPQFRDRLPAGVMASPAHTDILRQGFSFLTRFLDELFDRLQYREGDEWPLWKLLGAFALIGQEVGQSTARKAGARIYEQMPWPPGVETVVDALQGIDPAFRMSHGDASEAQVGGWPVRVQEAGRLVIANTSPYPDWVDEGVLTGVLRAFPQNRATFHADPAAGRKSDGADETLYVVEYFD